LAVATLPQVPNLRERQAAISASICTSATLPQVPNLREGQAGTSASIVYQPIAKVIRNRSLRLRRAFAVGAQSSRAHGEAFARAAQCLPWLPAHKKRQPWARKGAASAGVSSVALFALLA
ncbi:MAG: hypothetical protein V3T92_01605, partial [Anaerolineae bacterium]